MAKQKITEITTKIVELLNDLDSDERKRVFNASFILLGETPITNNNSSSGTSKNNNSNTSSENNVDNKNEGENNFARPVINWMKQNGITNDQLSEVFHIEEENINIIASDVPGTSAKLKTVNAYILEGIRKFLLTGETSFDDGSARIFCQHLSCYDMKNHATYLNSGKGNRLTGTKNAGWKLTSPGLKEGAEIIKQIING